jgi:hypothetical protein
VVARFPDEDDDMLAAYRAGRGVDSIGGAEAIISHLITKELGIPCAHAPAMPASDVDASVVRTETPVGGDWAAGGIGLLSPSNGPARSNGEEDIERGGEEESTG